jgi:hypothetical protein
MHALASLDEIVVYLDGLLDAPRYEQSEPDSNGLIFRADAGVENGGTQAGLEPAPGLRVVRYGRGANRAMKEPRSRMEWPKRRRPTIMNRTATSLRWRCTSQRPAIGPQSYVRSGAGRFGRRPPVLRVPVARRQWTMRR